MSQVLKDKMYDYEAVPPQGVWESIALALDNEQQTEPPGLLPDKKNRVFRYIGIAAAAAAVLIAALLIFRSNGKNVIPFASSDSNNIQQNLDLSDNNSHVNNKQHDAILRVPVEDSLDKKSEEQLLASNTQGSERGPAEKVQDDSDPDNANTDSKKGGTKKSKPHVYVTIAGPDGQPVKVSEKAAALLSSDADSPADPKWNKKVKEWKSAMQNNTLAATPGNFMDIVELTNTLRDN